MKTMTVRNIPDEVADLLKRMAETSDSSTNAMVVQVLSDSVLPRRKKRVGNDFSKYCGGWSKKEFDDFEAAIADCEKVDTEDWK